MQQKRNAPSRSVLEVGPGDFVKVGKKNKKWVEVKSNTAFGLEDVPRSWDILTVDGKQYGMFDIWRYAKAVDMVGSP